MRPGQGAIGSMGRAPLGANLGLWTMAGRLSNMNNTNVLGSPSSMAGRLGNIVASPSIADRLGNVLASPSMAARLGNINNKANVLSSSSRLNITNHLNKNAANKPGTKVKRLNQENGPRFNAFNTNASKSKAKALTKPSKNADGVVETVSREYLDCHMCNVRDFDSINDYILHLEGVNHTAMSKAYSLKCTANLELFKAEAKITALRAITKALENKKETQTQTQYCQKCQCTLIGGLAIHEKSSEHLQVINYLGVRCCGTSFNSRLELEEHWLSLQHIQYRSKLFAKFKNQGMTLQKEDENMQKLSALATAEPRFDVSTWPAFDPTVPVGLKYVDTGATNNCKVCSEYLEPQAVVILSHCCSSKHYQNMCVFYKPKDLQKNNVQISEVKKETETRNEDQEMAKIDLILNSRANKVKEIPSKVESAPAETEPKDSSNTDVNQPKETIVKTSLSPVSKKVNEESEDFGTVLETSILSEEAKNESVEEKSDKNDSVEDVKEDITEQVQENTSTVETKEILPEAKNESVEEKTDKNDSVEDVKEEITEQVQENASTVETKETLTEDVKDNSNTDQEQEKVETEKESSVELSASSSSLSSKLAVISEEECDVCESGSGDCEKHNAPGSPKRKNSGDLKVEMGTPKKLRTEEPAVGTPTRRSRRRSVSEEPTTVSTPTRTSRRKSISEEPSAAPATPTRISGRRKSITQL